MERRKRRRSIVSDWLDTLAESKSARRLRNEDKRSTSTSLNLYRTCEERFGSLMMHYETSAANETNSPTGDNFRDMHQADGDLLEEAQRATQYMPGVLEDLRRQQSSVPQFYENYDLNEDDTPQEAAVFQPISSDEEREDDRVNESTIRKPGSTLQHADMESLKSTLAMWEGDLNLVALVSVVGSVRFTVNQYEFMKDVLTEKSQSCPMPPYSRVHKHFQNVIGNCLPDSIIVALPKKNVETHCNDSDSNTESDTQDLEDTEENLNPRDMQYDRNRLSNEDVRVFLPSSWAKLDVATLTTFQKMYPALSLRSNRDTVPPLEHSRIIQERQDVTNTCDRIFVRNGIANRLCSRGCEVKITVQNEQPEEYTSHCVIRYETGYALVGEIVATWCVGSLASTTPNAERALLIDTLTVNEIGVIKYLSKGKARCTRINDSPNHFLPGDIRTLLSIEEVGEPFVVITHRFWRYEKGIPSIELVWLQEREEHVSPPACEYNVVLKHVVATVHLHRTNTPLLPLHRQALSTHGTLRNGLQYVVYRLLLYCDDFQKSSQMSPQGSAGGCYLLPLTLPVEARRSTSSVRIISLTPQGVSTNEVLHYIVDDLVTATVEGVTGYTPYGDEVRIFIDVAGFIGDYPAASGTIDAIGHVGRASCTLCSFRRLHPRDAEGSKFGYTTDVHSSNSTFLRHAERSISLRRSELTDADSNRLGMRSNSKFSNHECPLFHLQSSLDSRRHDIPLSKERNAVVSGMFDAYRSNVIAPDHLLTGLSKNILNAMYKTLLTEQMRLEAD